MPIALEAVLVCNTHPIYSGGNGGGVGGASSGDDGGAGGGVAGGASSGDDGVAAQLPHFGSPTMTKYS